MKNFIKTFLADESGASAAEYALILAIVGAGIGFAAYTLGDNVNTAIAGAANKVQSCTGPLSGGAVPTAATC